MSEQRYGFVERNFQANAYDDDKNLQQPLLILLGDQDLNVDIHETNEKLLTLFRHRNNLQISIISNASHGLLKAKGFNQQSPRFLFWLKLMWRGEAALAPDFLPVLGEWINRKGTLHLPKSSHAICCRKSFVNLKLVGVSINPSLAAG
jgi:hypothetical protein